MNALRQFLSREAGQQRRAWLDDKTTRAGNALAYYLGPTGIPERLNALGEALNFTDAGDFTEAADASAALWNDPTIGNAARYAAAGTAMALPFYSARMGEGFMDLVNEGVEAYDPNTVRIFAGRNAKTADMDALARAEDMAKSGASRDDIWRDTGWFQGVDGKWRFEIDDSGAENDIVAAAADVAFPGGLPLAGAIDHGELYSAYPDLANVNTYLAPRSYMDKSSPGAYGGVTSGGSVVFRDDLIDTGRPMHELQHLVQRKEGFARGGSPEAMSFEDYQRLSGEVEARNVEMRSQFDAALRRAVPPWETQDINDADQIVSFGDGPQAAVNVNQLAAYLRSIGAM